MYADKRCEGFSTSGGLVPVPETDVGQTAEVTCGSGFCHLQTHQLSTTLHCEVMDSVATWSTTEALVCEGM